MMHLCERCRALVAALGYNKDHDEYWCESCFDNEAEAAYERQQARDLESPPESARVEQLRTWEEKQKLKGR
jgi:hypothetical protein